MYSRTFFAGVRESLYLKSKNYPESQFIDYETIGLSTEEVERKIKEMNDKYTFLARDVPFIRIAKVKIVDVE